MPIFNNNFKKWLGLTSVALGALVAASLELIPTVPTQEVAMAPAVGALARAKPAGLSARQEQPLVRPAGQTWIF